MFTAVAELLSILDLEQIEHNIYRGRSPAGRLAARLRRARHLAGAGRRRAHRRGARAALAALLFHPARRPQRADHLRGRPHPRRQELHDAPGRGDPARPRDFLARRLVPDRGGGARPRAHDAEGDAARRPAERSRVARALRRHDAGKRAALVRPGAADRDAAGRPEALCRPRQADGPGRSMCGSAPPASCPTIPPSIAPCWRICRT